MWIELKLTELVFLLFPFAGLFPLLLGLFLYLYCWHSFDTILLLCEHHSSVSCIGFKPSKTGGNDYTLILYPFPHLRTVRHVLIELYSWPDEPCLYLTRLTPEENKSNYRSVDQNRNCHYCCSSCLIPCWNCVFYRLRCREKQNIFASNFQEVYDWQMQFPTKYSTRMLFSSLEINWNCFQL